MTAADHPNCSKIDTSSGLCEKCADGYALYTAGVHDRSQMRVAICA